MSFISVLTTVCIFNWALQVELAAATSVTFIDNDTNTSLEAIVRDICWSESPNKQILRVSTVGKVVDYLKSLPREHEFASCAQNNLPTLKHLKLVLAHGNENACSQTKLAFIEAFHRRFIDTKNPLSIREPPSIIRAFFLQYASMLSRECATSVLNFLQSYLENNDIALDQDIKPVLESYLKQFRTHIDTTASEYNHIFLVWGLIDQWPASVTGQIANYLRHGLKRISIKVKNAQLFERVQSVCLNKLRPVYQESLLPSLRLINLGYYPPSHELIQRLSSHSSAKSLYEFVQLCEAIIPIGVVSDSSMADGRIIFLTNQESEPLESNSGGPVFFDQQLAKADPVSLIGVDELDWIRYSNSSIKMVARVEQDLYERDSSLSRMMRVIAGGASRSFLKNLFVSSGDGVVRKFESAFGKVKDAIKEQNYQQLQQSGNQEHRSKRAIFLWWTKRNRWTRMSRCRGICICFSPIALIRNVFYFFILTLLMIAYLAISMGY